MNSDFEEQLMDSLHGKAEQIRPEGSLAVGAMRQAHDIQRRRRVAGVVAAVAVIAIAVPVGIQMGASSPNGSPGLDPVTQGTNSPTTPSATQEPNGTTVDLVVSDLPLGAPPSVTYVEGQILHAGDANVEVPADSLDLSAGAQVVMGSDGFYVGSQDRKTGAPSFDMVSTDGTITHVASDQVSGLRASNDGRYVAYATGYAPNTRLHLIDTETGDSAETGLVKGQDLQVLQIIDGTVWFRVEAGLTGGQLLSWAPTQTAPTIVMEGARPTALSADAGLVAVLTKIDQLEPGSCTDVRDVTTGETLWGTCRYGIGGFSPSGTYVLTVPEYQDGYADNLAGALDARTGELVAEFSSTQRHFASFMRSTFDDDSNLLMQVEQDGATAIVRCDLGDNSCENSVPVVPGSYGEGNPPYSLGTY